MQPAVYFYAVKFCFQADVDGVPVSLAAERIYRSQQSERYKLSIIGTDYTIIVQSNRPAVLGKKKGESAKWHLVEGTAIDKTKLEPVYRQLERAIDDEPSSFQGTLNFIAHF